VKPTFEMPHGGDMALAERVFGKPADGWLDLSTGISPFAYPIPRIPDDAWTALPQSSAIAALEAAARARYAAPDTAGLVAAPGTQALIQLMPSLAPPARVLVVSPTYSEHAIAFAAAGWDVEAVETLPTTIAHDVRAVVVTTPNNPDGRTWPREDIVWLAEKLSARGGLLVADEAFADAAPADEALTARCGPDGLVVLRSFGKFFGLAGLRLGFAIGAAPEIDALRKRLGPWAVSGPAAEIGRAALADDAWIEGQRRDITDARGRLTDALTGNGFDVVGHGHLFVTVSHPHATRLHGALAMEGVWVRRFDDAPNWLRFGLPSPADAARVSNALDKAIHAVL